MRSSAVCHIIGTHLGSVYRCDIGSDTLSLFGKLFLQCLKPGSIPVAAQSLDAVGILGYKLIEHLLLVLHNSAMLHLINLTLGIFLTGDYIEL